MPKQNGDEQDTSTENKKVPEVKQPEKKEGPKELSQETIDEMYNELCKRFNADGSFDREDIINAILQSQGDIETAKDILFS